jgi:hypothetical protein
VTMLRDQTAIPFLSLGLSRDTDLPRPIGCYIG